MEKTNNKSFTRNVLTLISGTALAQLISIVCMVVLQRYFYSPEDYAPFRLFFEFVAVFAGISAFRLESGIVLEQEENQARALTRICFKLIIATSIISFIVFWIYAQFNSQFDSILENPYMTLLIPVAVFLTGLLQVFNSWFTKVKSFQLMSVNKVLQNSTGSGAQLLMGFLKVNFYGLIIGRIIGLAIASILFFKKYISSFTSVFKSSREQNRNLIKKHKDFILYTSPAFFVGNLINFLLLALFIEYYGSQFGGKVAASFQYLGISIAIISSSFSQVYFSEISTYSSKSALRKTYTYWVLRLGLIAIAGATIIQFIPESFILAILGEKWTGLLEIMQIMSLWMAVMFVASSLSYIFIKLGKQKQILFFDIFHLILVAGSILIADHYYHSSITTLWLFTIAQIFFYGLAILLAYYYISKYKNQASE